VELLGDRAKVDAVLADYRTAAIPEKERALFAYLEKVTLRPAEIAADDLRNLQEMGWSDEAIYDAVMVCGLFSFYNRWIDAMGVHHMTSKDYEQSGKRLAARGYLPTR
jgi:uncharacterized peroxidase-related enzyme